MTALQMAGASLLAAVFAALFSVMARDLGTRAALAVWGSSVCMTGLIVLGVFLVTGALS